jgi:phage major head subunit gpT-like protein
MTSYNPTLFEAGVRETFLRELKGADAESIIPQVATVVDSNKKTEEHAWIGESPAMSLWEGQAKWTPMSDTKYSLTNNRYQGGLSFKVDDINDDQVGAFPLRIAQLAQGVVGHQNELLVDALVDGTSNTGHDATAFFANSHPIRGQMSAVQDNLLGGTGTTTAQLQADVTSAIAAMAKFEAENGKPYHNMLREFTIVCPWDILGNVNEAVYAKMISNTDNVKYRGMTIDVLPSAHLTDANDWYLLHTGGALRPLIFQLREAVSLLSDTQGSHTIEYMEHRFSLSGRYVAGYGHWASAVKMVNS